MCEIMYLFLFIFYWFTRYQYLTGNFLLFQEYFSEPTVQQLKIHLMLLMFSSELFIGKHPNRKYMANDDNVWL